MKLNQPSVPVDDLRAIRDVIADLHEFSGGSPRDRRALLEMAGLGRFVPGSDLNGAPLAVATSLLSSLSNFGTLPERRPYTALGALLAYVLSSESDLSMDDQAFLAKIIVRHQLIKDPSYIGRLRDTYKIDELPTTVGDVPPPTIADALPKTVHRDDPEFTAALDRARAESLEQVLGSEDNFLDVELLVGALYCAKAVALIEIPEGSPQGTGFLVNHDVLLTNQHVLRNEKEVREAVIRFDYRADSNGIASPGRVFRLVSDFYESSPPEKLDFALIRTQGAPLADLRGDALASTEELMKGGKHRGYLTLAPRFLRRNERVNIIQHPKGHPLKVVLTQNRIVEDMTDSRVQYVADTQDGSSGSPVLDQHWNVVALHHSGQPYPSEGPVLAAKKAWRGVFRVNEGITVRAILKELQQSGLARHLP